MCCLYQKGASLAIHGDDSSPFWICKTTEDVFHGMSSFKAHWYEQDLTKTRHWFLTSAKDSVPLDSVIRQVTLRRLSKNVFTMTECEFKRSSGSMEEEQVPEPLESKKKSKSKSSNKSSKVKVIASKIKKTKTVKVKVDKSNPNWRLKPRDDVSNYLSDPFFESKSLDFPFISSTHYSRLLIRSILLNDKKLLKSLVRDQTKVNLLNVRRSLADDRGPILFAILNEDREALKLLLSQEIINMPRASDPIQLIETVPTGIYNFRSLGIRRIRRIEASRGGREGNNALTRRDTKPSHYYSEFILANTTNKDFLDFLIKEEITFINMLSSKLTYALYKNNVKLAAYMLKKCPQEYEFTSLHYEALTAKDWSKGTKGMKQASVVKKGKECITPLHLAAMNPNAEVFRALFSLSSDPWVEDVNKRTPVHYAAASLEGIEVLKILKSRSASLELPDKNGYTPLAIATENSNLKVMEYLLSKNEVQDDESFTKRDGICGIDRPLKNSYCPIHLAAKGGQIDSLKVLLEHGVRVEKPLSAKDGKLTALMIAAAFGHLEFVRYLIEVGHAKVEATDKFKRTALTHAVMNGSTTVASYLLRMGADPERSDTSGNFNLHYACAYGWYHCVLLLLEAGVSPEPLNEWKISPCAIAFLKGHRGLGEYMLKIPGVSSNFQDSKGRTLLMHLLHVAEDRNSDELLSYIVYLTEVLKVDTQLLDIENKNAFHYFTEYLPYPSHDDPINKKSKMQKMILQIFDRLQDAGCNSCQIDDSGNLPIDKLFLQNNNINFDLVSKLIDAMAIDISRIKNIKNNTLNTMANLFTSLKLQNLKELKPIAFKVIDFFLLLNSKKLLNLKKFCMDNSELLFNLCKTYSNFPPIHSHELNHLSQSAYSQLWEEGRNILSYFLNNFQPCLRQKIQLKEKNGDRSAHSILLNALNEPLAKENDPSYKAGFEVLYKFDGDLEAIDVDGTTCLVRSIQNKNISEFEQYIAKGANIFVTYPGVNPTLYEKQGLNEEEAPLRDPLIASVLLGNLTMFKSLLRHGAVIPPKGILNSYPIFFTAVNEVLQDRNNMDRMNILKTIIGSNYFQESKTVFGFNALHMSVQNSTGDFNNNLEIESLLLKYGVSPTHKDDFGRLPLHYACVKESPLNKGELNTPNTFENDIPKDPIEVVSMVIDEMNPKFIDAADENGSTCLHFASFRGCTVCGMLLMEKGADMNRKDKFGNTPLAYAVAGKHEATTFTLLQRGADVNCQIHFNPHLLGSSCNNGRSEEGNKDSKTLFKYLPSHFKLEDPSRYPMTLFEASLLNNWLGVSYLIIERLEKYGLSIAEALEVTFKLQKHQFAKKLMLKQMNNKKLCELVSNKMNLISSLMKYSPRQDCEDHVIQFLIDHLYQAGNDLRLRDAFGCCPLHYGCLSNNIKLIRLIFSYSEVSQTVNEKDQNLRTPLMAVLWNNATEDTTLEIAKELFAHGANPNILSHFKKFDYVHNDFHPSTVNLRYFDRIADNYEELSDTTTPLHIAINIKARGLIDLLIQNGADLSMSDGLGRTPLMIAAKSNDADFLKYFWDACTKSRGINDISPPPSKKRKSVQNIINVSVNAKDRQGLNAMHHSLFRDKVYDGAYDNKSVINFLLKIGCDPLDKKNDLGVSALDISEKMRLPSVYHLLSKKSLQSQGKAPNNNKIMNSFDFPYDILKDAQAMFEILNKNIATGVNQSEYEMEVDSQDDDEITINSESGSDDDSDNENDDEDSAPEVKQSNRLPEGISLESGKLYKDYTTLLSKILVQMGSWGIYNFYRMQIWKDSHKDVYVLFTNWGRWGETGNYQNTPFGTPEQAVTEFEKIFKAKTENIWSNRNEFIPNHFKYRQMDIDTFVKRPRPKIKFDLRSDVPSKLPKEVQKSIKHISNVTMYSQAYESLPIDSNTIPFGQINKANITKAIEILDEIKSLIDEMSKLKQKSFEAKDTHPHEVFEKIQNKSNEYFYLMPMRHVAETTISPLTSKFCLEKEYRTAYYLLEFEFAERVLLGAQYRKNEVNPLDYIYHALSVQMTPLKPQDEMSSIILKYIYNSEGAQKGHTVDAIFKVSRSSAEDTIFAKGSASGATKLLWHGTRCVNLLSILSKGLIVDPPYAAQSGETFGKGVYTADVYDKSFDYCDRNHSYAYIFLCKADLGKVFTLKNGYYNDENLGASNQYDSIKVRGMYTPTEKDELYLALEEGLSAPLGSIIRPDDEYHCVNYSEYIIKNPSHISTDYLIRIKIR